MLNKIYIITDIPFPVGFAPTNRMISYAKGFNYNNCKAKVICFRKTESASYVRNEKSSGNYMGIEYNYLSNTTIKSKYLLNRKLDNCLMSLSLFYFSFKRIDRSSVVIYYSVHTFPALLLKLSAITKGFKILKEETEHPEIRLKRKSFISAYAYLKIHYKLFDGILLITQNLMMHFKKHYYGIPTLHVPMVVDFDRFKRNTKPEKTILYCGILNDSKDGINILIESFGVISEGFPDYKLILIGKSKKEDELFAYKKRVDELNLSDRVIFRGELSNQEIPEEISKSEILVLPRPDSIQARHGFPTKLGEYLATGNPVVTTFVGEIPLYLKDRINAYLANPGSIESLVEKLREVLSSPEKAKVVGENGRETAKIFFNNIEQTKKIIDFINDF